MAQRRAWGQPQVDLETSKNALRIAQETEQMGQQAMTELARQGEQLDRIENDVEKVHYNLEYGDRLLRGMSITGWLKNTFSGDKPQTQSQQPQSTAPPPVNRNTKPQMPTMQNYDPSKPITQNGPNGIARPSSTSILTANASPQLREAIAQQDKDLDQLSVALGNINGMARYMGSELDRQNQQLDHITTRVDSANVRVNNSNQKIDRMIK
eukprot:TRINITY_DN918_c1_g3_i1.p1 TRINITY_DN918_c1_g3~~TRINITY_DN918_c1_g3_i1.p1  ORF type:complete len:210 (-),score=122.00 TRINITY_DN918_c1_g3_i1:117-746(-)